VREALLEDMVKANMKLGDGRFKSFWDEDTVVVTGYPLGLSRPTLVITECGIQMHSS